MSELDIARLEQQQAARSVRRLAQECRTRRYLWLDRRLDEERKRLANAVEKLARLEATQPGGAGTPPPEPITQPAITRN